MKSQFAVQCAVVHIIQTVELITLPIPREKERKRRTTRPIMYRTWVTVRGAGEERVWFEQRDLRRIERSDAALLLGELKKARRSAENRVQ